MGWLGVSLAVRSTDSGYSRPREVARREIVDPPQIKTAALVWSTGEPHGVRRSFQARHVTCLHALRTS